MIANVFPTIEGQLVYKSKNVTPYFEIKLTDTPYPVNSHGLTSYWYAFPSIIYEQSFSAGYLVRQGTSFCTKFYSGQSYPTEISDKVHTSKCFGVFYVGYFVAPESGSYTFEFLGRGYVSCYLQSQRFTYQKLTMGEDTDQILDFSTTLTAGTKYLLVIYYWSPGKNEDNYSNVFCAKYKSPSMDKAVTIDAGVTESSRDYAVGVASTLLKRIDSCYLSETKNSSAKFTFSVPIVSTINAVGYKYVEDGDYFEDVESSSRYIKKFRKIEYAVGYEYASGSIATVKRFSGQVRSWQINRSSDRNMLEVTCYDWLSFLSDSINLGYPDVSDYLAYGYHYENIHGVDGFDKPIAFDSWKFEDAVSCLLLNSYIPYSVTHQKKVKEDVYGNLTNTYYLFHERNLDSKIILDRQLNYGNPFSNANSENDDKYIWQFSIGDRISDNLQKLMENYGFTYGFNNSGYFYVNAVKSPVVMKSVDDIAFSGSWSEEINVNALYGVSKTTSTADDYAQATFSGVEACIILDVDDTSCGTVNIRVYNSELGIVLDTDQRTKYTKEWHYYNGVDPNSGYNPCIISLGTTMPYGVYSITITNTDGDTSVNAIIGYNEPYEKETDIYYTGDNILGKGNVVSFDMSSDAVNVRTDVLVVGKLKGYNTTLMLEEDEMVRVNPNNPTADHVLARGVNIAAIGSVSNSEYVGRRLQTIIIEPKVGTEERALWLANETIERYRNTKKSVDLSLSILGNPFIEIGDKILIKDINTGVLSTISHSFWVESVNSGHGNQDFKTMLQLGSFEPWQSFTISPIPSLKRFNYNPFQNIKMYNFGNNPYNTNGLFKFLSFSGGTIHGYGIFTPAMISEDETTANAQDFLERMIPEQGIIRVGNEVTEYRTRTISNIRPPVITLGFVLYPNWKCDIEYGELNRGCYARASLSAATLNTFVSTPIDTCISPYSSEMHGITPGVQFDLIVPGQVKIDVYAPDGNILDTITGNENPSRLTGYEYLSPGRYYYSWGMLDRVGLYNLNNSGKFVYQNSDSDIPACSVSSLGDWELYGPYYDRKPIGGGFYPQNKKKFRYGSFGLYMRYLDVTQTYFDSIKVVEPKERINTCINPDGSGVALADRLYESISVTGTFVSSDMSTMWWNEFKQCYINPINVVISWVFGGASALIEEEKYFFTGEENDGRGVRIKINNIGNVDRIAKVDVSRRIFVSRQLFREPDSSNNVPYTETNDIEIITDTMASGITMNIDSVDGLTVYVTSPEQESFLTTAVLSDLASYGMVVSERYVLSETNPALLWYAVSHLHLIDILVTDMAGMQSRARVSAFYVPKEFLNTREDFINGVAKVSVLDGVNPYTMVNFASKGWEDSPSWRWVVESGNEPKYKEIASWDSGSKEHYVYNTEVMGVVVYGRGTW